MTLPRARGSSGLVETGQDDLPERGRGSRVRPLVFAFAIVPRNDMRFEAADGGHLGVALERPLISLSGPSAKSVRKSSLIRLNVEPLERCPPVDLIRVRHVTTLYPRRFTLPLLGARRGHAPGQDGFGSLTLRLIIVAYLPWLP